MKFPSRHALALVVILGAIGACEQERIDEQHVPKGVEPTAEPAQPAQPTTAMPPSPDAPAPVESSGVFPWTVPVAWTLSPETSAMRVATFVATVEGRPIPIAVTRFEGQVGGVLANVNRWRGQMGLPEIAEGDLEETLTRFGPPEWPGYTLRVAGESQHMLAAGVYERAQDRTWFARVTGAPADIGAIEPDFQAFVRSIGATPAP